MRAVLVLSFLACLITSTSVFGAEILNVGGNFGHTWFMNPTFKPTIVIQDDEMTSEIKTEESDSITADLSGEWNLILEDEIIRNVHLTLHQIGGKIFGFGSIIDNNNNNSNNNNKQSVTVVGSVVGDLLNIYIVTINGDTMFDLNFVSDNQLISGSYEVYFADGTKKIGTGNSTNLELEMEMDVGNRSWIEEEMIPVSPGIKHISDHGPDGGDVSESDKHISDHDPPSP